MLQRNGFYFFINGYDLFYNGRNSPESLQAYDPALGGYIIQVEITSNMQVPCHCQHAPWHLGANAKSFFAHLIEDPTHHIVMSRPLGATRCCSSLHDHIYKIPAHYCIMIRPLGLRWFKFFMSLTQLQVPGCCKHGNPTLGGYICGIFSLTSD